MHRTTLFVGTLVLAVACSSLSAHAQSGSRVIIRNGQSSSTQGSGTVVQQGSGSGSRVVATKTFEQKFWQFLKHGSTSYDEWGPFPENRAGLQKGQSPHGAMLRMYANKVARQNPKTLPSKSVIIKENYGPDGKTLMAITVMYRSAGYDPTHGDWYYVKYNPDGTVAKTPPEKGSMRIAGKFRSCIECHSSAEGNDFVFANDK